MDGGTNKSDYKKHKDDCWCKGCMGNNSKEDVKKHFNRSQRRKIKQEILAETTTPKE